MRKDHETRKTEIIQGALDLAAQVGVSAVTTQSIADRVGIAQPTVFRHFKTKEAIFNAAMEFIAFSLFKALDPVLTATGPADNQLKKLFSIQLKFISKRRGVPRLLFSDRLHVEDPRLRETVQNIFARYRNSITSILNRGVKEGVFRADLDPEETAHFIAATVQGLFLQWSVSGFEFSLVEREEALWNFIWPAIRS